MTAPKFCCDVHDRRKREHNESRACSPGANSGVEGKRCHREQQRETDHAFRWRSDMPPQYQQNDDCCDATSNDHELGCGQFLEDVDEWQRDSGCQRDAERREDASN